ncbi:hypothetical protein ACIOG7_35905 [Streptomyces sp. NPDC087894]|uniref:hypothetical protein n=1 Tax=Streptomyces sp. NPDC087894 TaxID=3365816 RepID=UPI003807ECCE
MINEGTGLPAGAPVSGLDRAACARPRTPTHSCEAPLWSLDGKEVTTIEGLITADRTHPGHGVVELMPAEGNSPLGVRVRSLPLTEEQIVAAKPI